MICSDVASQELGPQTAVGAWRPKLHCSIFCAQMEHSKPARSFTFSRTAHTKSAGPIAPSQYGLQVPRLACRDEALRHNLQAACLSRPPGVGESSKAGRLLLPHRKGERA